MSFISSGSIRWEGTPPNGIRTCTANIIRTEDCKTLHDFLEQLVKAGKLKQFTHQLFAQREQLGLGYQMEVAPRPPLGTINVIFAAPNKEAGPLSKVMAISPQLEVREKDRGSKRIKTEQEPILSFSEADKIGTFQPHDDALVVTL